jgi:NADPH:quinone reductase-like Zn-dependent oxidoreductase
MKAAVIKAPGVLEVQDIPEPVCEPDEIKVKDRLCRHLRQRPQDS